MGNKPNVLIIATGGTIASEISEGGGLSPKLGAQQLADLLIDSANRKSIEIELLQLMNKDSTNVDPKDWEKMIKAINENIQKYDGIVVLHGTDTLAYSASALSFIFRSGKPIVLTGSMHPAKDKGSDARDNFNLALRVAAGIIPTSGGVLIAFGGDILPGNNATKINTEDDKAFGLKSNNTDLGLISIVHSRLGGTNYPSQLPEEEKALLRSHEESLIETNTLLEKNFDEKVLAIHLTPGLNPDALLSLSEKFDGIILEAFGSGGIPDYLFDAISKISKKIPLVLVTQVNKGAVDLDEYEVGKKAKEAGVIDGRCMTTEAANTKLMYILARTKDLDIIRKFMETNISGELDNSSRSKDKETKQTLVLQKLPSIA
ncbi:MAG: asparaginase [Candidatus Micrarchaeia archaeon]